MQSSRGNPPVPWRHAWPLFRRFWPYLRPERRAAALTGLLSLVVIPAGLVTPLLFQQVFDDILPRTGEIPAAALTGRLLRVGAWILALTLVALVVGWWQQLIAIRMQARVHFRLARALFRHVLRLPLARLRQTDTGYLMARVRDDLEELGGLMLSTLVEGAVHLLRAVLLLAFLVWLDRGLAVSGMVLVALVLATVLAFSPGLRRRSAVARETDARAQTALHEPLSGLVTVRIAVRERDEGRRHAAAVQASLRAEVRRDVLGAATGTVASSAGLLGAYVVVLVGAIRITRGESTFGSLFAFFLVLTQLMGATGGVFALWPAVQKACASLQRIFELLDEPQESSPVRRMPALPVRARGQVEFRDVSFGYSPEVPVLKHVTLAVKPGEVVALVGRSGAGKTTLVQLLPRLFDPLEGEVLLDGQPLGAYPLEWLRRQIGYVPQDVFLFHRTVRENLCYVSGAAPPEAVRAAVRSAHALEFLEMLPEGLETAVGERGVRFSGGERQRLAMAREFLADPPLLILDEATSHLDARSESLIRSAMRELMHGRTCFLIAHRLSTVQDADRIVVLEEGRIAEQGTHEELLEKNGIYRRLHDLQLRGTPDAPLNW